MLVRELERQLKKSLPLVTQNWGGKQNDKVDKLTSKLVYSNTLDFDKFKELINTNIPTEYHVYACKRWFNYILSTITEYYFVNNKLCSKKEKLYHKTIDFYLDNIPFDLKSSAFPKSLYSNKISSLEVVKWLYNNQSKESRFHTHNRLFIVYKPSKHEDIYLLKSNLNLLKFKVLQYLDNWNSTNLLQLDNKVLTDIILIQDI